MGAQAGAAGPWWSRARATERGVGGAKRVHPEREPGRDGVQPHACWVQPSDGGSWQPPCCRQIAAPVPSGTAGSGPESFPTGPSRTALQCRFATVPGMLTRLRHPWPCSGAEVGPDTPRQTPGPFQSWVPLTLLFSFGVAPCCQAAAGPFRGTRRRGGSLPTIWCSLSSFQLGGCGVLRRAPSAVGQGRVPIFTAQLRDPGPGGIVWFCPHSR